MSLESTCDASSRLHPCGTIKGQYVALGSFPLSQRTPVLHLPRQKETLMEPDDFLHAFYATLRRHAPYQGVEDVEPTSPPFDDLPAPVQATWRATVWDMLSLLDQNPAADRLREDIPA